MNTYFDCDTKFHRDTQLTFFVSVTPLYLNVFQYFAAINEYNYRILESVDINGNIKTRWVNPFQPIVALLYPLKTSENLKVF